MTEFLVDRTRLAEHLQSNLFPRRAWKIEDTTLGVQKEKRFFGVAREKRVFVRLGVAPEIVTQLAESGITPPILSGKSFDGTPAYVQEYVDARPPDRQWNTDHWQSTASLIKRLQGLDDLRQHLPEPSDETYAGILRHYTGIVTKASETMPRHYPTYEKVITLVDKVGSKVENVQGEGLVPCHGDIHPENVLATSNGAAYLTDWEGLHLSDPLRDISQMIWRLPASVDTNTIVERFGFDLSDAKQRKRFNLHIATRALEIYIFFSKCGIGLREDVLDHLDVATRAVSDQIVPIN